MPKATRNRVATRGQVEVSAGSGNSGVPAATRASARAPTTGNYPVSPPDRSLSDALRTLSGTFAVLENEVRAAEAKREAEARQAASKANAEAQARIGAVDRIAGEVAGIRLLAEIDEKSRTGGMDLETAHQHIASIAQNAGNSQAFMKAWEPYAKKSLQVAGQSEFGKRQAEEMDSYLAVTRQGFNDLHSSYDPERYDDYAQARTAIFESRNSLGIPGQSINAMELSSLVNQVKRVAGTDPLKAQELIDLAERLRPDGSPSLAASIPDGYATIQTLRDSVAQTVLEDSINEKKEAAAAVKESTTENYVSALTELIRMENPEAAAQWAAENVESLSDAEFKAKFGDYRADIMKAVQAAKSNQSPPGNDLALAEYMEGIQRGTTEWDDVNADSRLNHIQKQKLFASMKEITQKAQLGYLSDAHLAGKLLVDLESSWSDSVYRSPWSASRQLEPGKPPIVSPEGLFYQGELFKRLRQMNPDLDVTESNRTKLEVVQDLRDEILSGRLRWANESGKLQEPVPQLKLSQKVKEGERLTEDEVTAVAKTLNGGGVKQVQDAFGVDYFTLDGSDQKRIAAEVQRQKAELESLQSGGFFNRMFKNIGSVYGDGSAAISH